MAAYHSLRFVQLLKKSLPKTQVWTKRNNTSIVVSAQAVLMTALTEFEPLAKRLRVEVSVPTSPSLQVPFSCTQSRDNEKIDQEQRPKDTDIKMDVRPKTGVDALRGVKTKSYHQRIGSRPQHKLRNSLDRWLVKPSKSTAEVCPTLEDVDMTDEGGSESTSAEVLNCQNAESSTLSDSGEETQLLTPQELDEPVSPVTIHSTGSEGSENEVETHTASSEDSLKRNIKITDFFSRTSSPGLPVRQAKPDESPEKQDADEETSSGAKWLGVPISELRRMPECGRPLPQLKDVPGQHTVMIRTDLLQSSKVPVPYPSKFEDTWDDVHVKMPCSSWNLFPVQDEETLELQTKSRWELIKETLSDTFSSHLDLKNAILKYSASQAKKWDFTALNLYCTKGACLISW